MLSPVNLFGEGRLATSFHNDQDFFLRVSSGDPLTDWIDQARCVETVSLELVHPPSSFAGSLQGDWGGDDHCVVTGRVVRQIRFPREWTSASDCVRPPDDCRSKPGQSNNNAMGVLLEDNETIVQMQPAYRCAWGSPLLARFGNESDGCPQQFPNVTSILGDGALGSHGGSGLSGVGGTIRY